MDKDEAKSMLDGIGRVKIVTPDGTRLSRSGGGFRAVGENGKYKYLTREQAAKMLSDLTKKGNAEKEAIPNPFSPGERIRGQARVALFESTHQRRKEQAWILAGSVNY